jgi:hypothetical protein
MKTPKWHFCPTPHVVNVIFASDFPGSFAQKYVLITIIHNYTLLGGDAANRGQQSCESKGTIIICIDYLATLLPSNDDFVRSGQANMQRIANISRTRTPATSTTPSALTSPRPWTWKRPWKRRRTKPFPPFVKFYYILLHYSLLLV